jgi:hypothetical protein
MMAGRRIDPSAQIVAEIVIRSLLPYWDIYADIVAVEVRSSGETSNDVMGDFYLFLRDTLSRFCNHIRER